MPWCIRTPCVTGPAGSSTITWTKPAGKGTVVWSKGASPPSTGLRPIRLRASSSSSSSSSSTRSRNDVDTVASPLLRRRSPRALRGPATATQPPNLCIDSSAADNESPIGLSACAADNVVSADQLFTFTQGRYIVLNPAATSAQKCLSKAGSFKKCCIENWHRPGETGDCTVFGCNSEQSTKLWTYVSGSGSNRVLPRAARHAV